MTTYHVCHTIPPDQFEDVHGRLCPTPHLLVVRSREPRHELLLHGELPDGEVCRDGVASQQPGGLQGALRRVLQALLPPPQGLLRLPHLLLGGPAVGGHLPGQLLDGRLVRRCLPVHLAADRL
eukprot:scaffold74963_cov42-Prasinocladus_malaysianus.AAC.1